MRYPYRSFFWPGILIAAGVVALLVNTGVVPSQRLYLLWDLWPVLLIVVGLEIIARRIWQGGLADLAGALIVLVAIAGALGYVALTPPATQHSSEYSGQMVGSQAASMELDLGSATIEMAGGSDMGGNLYTAHIDYLGRQPTVEQNGNAIKISEETRRGNPFVPSGSFSVRMMLNPAVSWTIRENTGDSTEKLSLGGVRLAGLSQNTGDSTDDITLGPPTGRVTLHVNSGDLTLHVHRPSSAASVNVNGGSIKLTADGGATRNGDGHVTYESPGFGSASDAYVIEVNSGDSTITLDTNAASG